MTNDAVEGVVLRTKTEPETTQNGVELYAVLNVTVHVVEVADWVVIDPRGLLRGGIF
jgi:hypothetical protein